MIDAISIYSSNHAGRREQQNVTKNSFGRLYTTETDYFIKKGLLKSHNPTTLFVVGGCAATMSMIIDTLCASADLAKGNMIKVSEIMRNAFAMAVIAGLLYGGIKLIENFAEEKTKI